MQYWLLKSEPASWSWEQQKSKGEQGESWNGVRNYQANNNMKAMKIGDLGFFYHSVSEKSIVGIVKVIKEHYPDHTDETGRFGMVDVACVKDMKRPISLEEIKAHSELQNMALVKQSRLSVTPITKEEWDIICGLGGI